MNYFVPEGQNYIILESLNSIKENQYPLSIHVLMFIEDSEFYILGRGHESDVRISDISVSRSHAKICMKDKKFYLEDTGSKFGTLVLAKDDVEVKESQQILQIGRTLISTTEFDFSKHVMKSVKEEYANVNQLNSMNAINENDPSN
jgi:pSer/pThr/pTyr-binding forkhead associated (FHA) protein